MDNDNLSMKSPHEGSTTSSSPKFDFDENLSRLKKLFDMRKDIASQNSADLLKSSVIGNPEMAKLNVTFQEVLKLVQINVTRVTEDNKIIMAKSRKLYEEHKKVITDMKDLKKKLDEKSEQVKIKEAAISTLQDEALLAKEKINHLKKSEFELSTLRASMKSMTSVDLSGELYIYQDKKEWVSRVRKRQIERVNKYSIKAGG